MDANPNFGPIGLRATMMYGLELQQKLMDLGCRGLNPKAETGRVTATSHAVACCLHIRQAALDLSAG